MSTRELAEIDEKLKTIRTAKSELERLETFLEGQRQAMMTKVGASYLSQVRVSQQEIDAQVKRANDLTAKWNKR